MPHWPPCCCCRTLLMRFESHWKSRTAGDSINHTLHLSEDPSSGWVFRAGSWPAFVDCAGHPYRYRSGILFLSCPALPAICLGALRPWISYVWTPLSHSLWLIEVNLKPPQDPQVKGDSNQHDFLPPKKSEKRRVCSCQDGVSAPAGCSLDLPGGSLILLGMLFLALFEIAMSGCSKAKEAWVKGGLPVVMVGKDSMWLRITLLSFVPPTDLKQTTESFIPISSVWRWSWCICRSPYTSTSLAWDLWPS